MKRFLFGGLFLALFAAGNAQTYYVRGTFFPAPGNNGGWDDLTHPLTDIGGGLYEANLTGLAALTTYTYKVATATWSEESPSDIVATTDSTGSIKITLNKNAADPKMFPNSLFRAGFDNNNAINYEVMGNFPDGGGFSATPTPLTYDSVTKKYSSAIFNLTPAMIGQNFEFKVRKAGDWGVAYGNNFGNLSGNVQFTPQADWAYVQFVFDPTRGQLGAVPEPASMAALGLGLLGLARRRRSK